MIRPPDMQSSIAISSASRTGWPCSAGRLPRMPILMCFVRWVSAAAIRLGDGISPYGLLWCSFMQTASKPYSSYRAICSRCSA